MRRALLITAVVFQVLVLVFMAGKREYIIRTGTAAYFRTAPLDPRDLFRGDYVRLQYEVSAMPYAKAENTIVELIKKNRFGRTVYAPLAVGEGGLAEVSGLVAEKPASGLFLKGRTAVPWRFGILSHEMIAVEYGIEAYYLQEGKGVEVEKQRGTRTTIQTPLEMEVAIGGDGTAVIRGHRWSPIGIGLEAIESPRRDNPQGRKSAKLRFTFKNASGNPLAIVNLPGHCALFLESAGASTAVQVPARPACAGLAPVDDDIIMLQPGEARFYDIDLADPAWYVMQNNTSVETGSLPWNERFRIVYRPPAAAASAMLRNAAFIWHGHLPSRAFHGAGNID